MTQQGTHFNASMPLDRPGIPAAIATPRMQGYPEMQPQSHFNRAAPLQGGTSYTPTLPPKFPPAPLPPHSLTPQLIPKHHPVPLSNQLSALTISQSQTANQNPAFPAHPLLVPSQNTHPSDALFPPLNPPVPSNPASQPTQTIGMHAPTFNQQTPVFNQFSLPSSQPIVNRTSQPMGLNLHLTSQPMGLNLHPTSQPMGLNLHPTNQPMGLNIPSSQPMGLNLPPSNQPMGLNIPSNQPMGFSIPSSQPMGLNIPSNQPTGFNIPSSQPMGLNIPSNQPMGFNIPPSQPMGLSIPSSQPMGLSIPSSQPMGLNLPSSQPMGPNLHPTSQPMGLSIPSNQPMGFNMPSSQPMGLNLPSSQMGLNLPSSQMGLNIPSNQPMGFNMPSNQPMGLNLPPTNQPMGLNLPPTNQPMGLNLPLTNQPMGLNLPPTNQPMGLNQFPPQLTGPGQQPPADAGPQMGQFGVPPVTSQPRVTPDSIPSVVEVLAMEKERWVSNEYLTGSRTPPPGVLISCPIRDTGNASPRFLRSSLYTLPASADMVRESKLVAGLIIQPLASDPDNQQLPLVDHGPGGPIRCKRCKAYMNPFNNFSGGGASYSCIFCDVSNEVPQAYFQYCDAAGKRMDAAERPELSLGSYELCVTKDYMRFQREGGPPAVVVVVDISMRSYNTGLEGFLSSHLGELLESLPRDETGQCPMEVGLVLYDTQAYYFNLSAPLPLVYVMTEPSDPFLPEPAGSLVPVPQAVASIRGVLQTFPSLFPQRRSGGSLGTGVRAGLSLLSESRRVGKLIVFQADIPEIHGPGQIKRRTDNFFKPQTQFYEKLSADCQRAGVSVDLFLLPSAYTDVFTLGQLCHYTGGQLHYHYNFSASKPASYSRLLSDLQETFGAQMGFDAVMRVRTSPGLSPEQYQGAIRLSGTEVQLSACDANKSIAVVLRYEDKLKENSLAYIQVALLYTNFKGERRLRLHNLALCTSSHFEDVYLSADLEAMVQLLARLSLRGFLEEPMETVGDRIRQQVAHILAAYRRHCNPGLNKGQLILPASMKLLPCYSNCILKLPVAPLNTSPNSPDIRAYSFYRLQWLSTREFLLQLYPRVYPLDPDLSSLPDPIRASLLRIEEHRVYLVTDGQQVVLWVGNGLHMNIVAQVFGVSSVHQVDPSLSTLPKLDNNTSRHLHESLERLQAWTGKRLALSLSKQGDPSEQLFRGLLVEDGVQGRASYVDGTCMLHREIKKLLS